LITHPIYIYQKIGFKAPPL